MSGFGAGAKNGERRKAQRQASIARRLTLTLSALALAIFFLTSVILDRDLMVALHEQEAAEITSHVAMAKHYIQTRANDIETLQRELDDLLESHPELRIWVATVDGRLHYGNAPPPFPAAADQMVTVQAGRSVMKAMVGDLDVAGPLGGARVLVAVDGTVRDQLMKEHRLTLILVSLIATAAIAASTAIATRRGLAPIRHLSDEAARISPGELGRRLSVGDTALELHDLAQAFNAVLDRLEEAYRQLDSFNADVAHELRTPLATMINGIQVTLSSRATSEEIKEALLSNLEELEGLKRMVNDMLFLARADRGEPALDIQQLSLASEVAAVLDYFEAALQEAGVSATVKGDANTHASGSLVRRAVSNLVSNAVRYTARGGTIEIVLESEPNKVVVRVRNPGQPIARDEIGRIFERFYRAGSAASRSQEGSGLGLSIVRAIARMHGGEAFARSGEDVTEVGFTLRGTG